MKITCYTVYLSLNCLAVILTKHARLMVTTVIFENIKMTEVYVAYDRACDLQPFLAKRQRKDVYLASYLMKHVKFFVDRFHVRIECAPRCQFRMQCFRWLNKNKYKATVRNTNCPEHEATHEATTSFCTP